MRKKKQYKNLFLYHYILLNKLIKKIRKNNIK